MAVYVIGLGGRESLNDFCDLLAGSYVVARSLQVAAPLLPGGVTVRQTFDTLFQDNFQAGLASRIASEVLQAAETAGDVAYLVPGSGATGDSTVEQLARSAVISIEPGQHLPSRPLGSLKIIDALELAEAENRLPFDAGLVSLDSQSPLLVTNLYGPSVVDLAFARLRRTHPAVDVARAVSGELLIDAVDPLDEARSLGGFERIIAQLRSPQGCPWDRQQTLATLQPQLLEEVEELGDAIESADPDNVVDELGDVLLHVVMMSQIAREERQFSLEDVIAAVSAKMVRRHPHVFGDVEIDSIEELYDNWNRIKAAEQARRGGD